MTILRCHGVCFSACLLLLFAQSAHPQQRARLAPQLMVQVEGLDRRPIAGARLTVRGQADVSAPTTPAGRTRIPLGPGTQPGTWVTLRLIQSPPGKDLAILSPWDEQAMLPPAGAAVQNYISVVLVERRARRLLEDPVALGALMRRVLGTDQPQEASPTKRQEVPVTPRIVDLAEAQARVAQEFGLSVESLAAALQTWSTAPKANPLERGLAALYEGRYREADDALVEVDTATEQRLISVKLFRSRSLLQQGRLAEAVAVLEPALRLRPNDPRLLSQLGTAFLQTGNDTEAELLLRRALAIRERELGAEHPDVAPSLNNLAIVLYNKGDYEGAKPLVRRALVIEEKAFGPQHLAVATSLTNLGSLLRESGDYTEAEPLLRRALAIRERELGAEHPDVASSLNNLASLLQEKGDYAGAEPLYRRALAINEKVLGAEHPRLAASLNNFAILLAAKGDYVGAELLLKRGLAIFEITLGPANPEVAHTLVNLASVLATKGETTAAEPLLRRALLILEQTLGGDHPSTRRVRAELAVAMAAGS